MRKMLSMLLILLAVGLAIVWPALAVAKINIVATIPDLADIAQQVGGDYVDVISLVTGDRNPHFLDAKPSYAAKLNRADLLLENGLDLEIGWLPVIVKQAANPKIVEGEGRLNLADYIRPLEIPTGVITRAHGDVHPNGNPHYLLDPHNGLRVAQAIANRLAQLDPTHAADYQANHQKYSTTLTRKIAQWQRQAAVFSGKKVITHHKSFPYFADWTGLQIVGQLEPKPGIPPTPSHVAKVIEQVGTEKISLLIVESFYSDQAAKKVTREAKVPYEILPAYVGAMGVTSYLGLFDLIIEKIETAIQ